MVGKEEMRDKFTTKTETIGVFINNRDIILISDMNSNLVDTIWVGVGNVRHSHHNKT